MNQPSLGRRRRSKTQALPQQALHSQQLTLACLHQVLHLIESSEQTHRMAQGSLLGR